MLVFVFEYVYVHYVECNNVSVHVDKLVGASARNRVIGPNDTLFVGLYTGTVMHNKRFRSVRTQIHHLNWTDNYKKMRAALGIHWPGYMIHESGVWSEIRRKWYFLPRRCSKEKYNETKDEHNGCNVLISADENFDSIDVVKVS